MYKIHFDKKKNCHRYSPKKLFKIFGAAMAILQT